MIKFKNIIKEIQTDKVAVIESINGINKKPLYQIFKENNQYKFVEFDYMGRRKVYNFDISAITKISNIVYVKEKDLKKVGIERNDMFPILYSKKELKEFSLKYTKYNLRFFKKRKPTNNIGEQEIRLALKKRMQKKNNYLKDEFTTMRLRTRADMVSFSNKKIDVYEIKSDKDSFTRLEKQIQEYRDYADTITIVIGEKKLSAFNKNHVEKYPDIGILVYKDGKLKEIRKPKELKPKKIISLLWKKELYQKLFAGYIGLSSYSSSKLMNIAEQIFKKDDLDSMVRKILTARYTKEKIYFGRNDKIQEKINEIRLKKKNNV